MKKVYVINHHGIKGMKWGKRNGPPYPLGADQYSVREKRKKYKQAKSDYRKTVRKSSGDPDKDYKRYMDASAKKESAKQELKDAKKERNTKEISRLLGCSESQAETAKRIAKIAGISLATGAGLLAAGYLVSKYGDSISSLSESVIAAGKEYVDDGRITGNLFVNGLLHDSIGSSAKSHNYREITGDFIRNAISNRTESSDSNLINNVRINQVDALSPRRLSCWSTSMSYYLSSLTGKSFASMSFENLVDFNSFGKLYKEKPKIFDAFGNEASDFVGKFGRGEDRIKFDEQMGKDLIKNMFDNVPTSNLIRTKDGSKTVGFMNAAYRGMTCTHEWNFEIHNTATEQILKIVDGYAGTSFKVASRGRGANDPINYFTGKYVKEGFDHFMEELYHYNADSLRFYAPKLESIIPDEWAKFILGK